VGVLLEGRLTHTHTHTQVEDSMAQGHTGLDLLLPEEKGGPLYVLMLLSFFPLYCWLRGGGERRKSVFVQVWNTFSCVFERLTKVKIL